MSAARQPLYVVSRGMYFAHTPLHLGFYAPPSPGPYLQMPLLLLIYQTSLPCARLRTSLETSLSSADIEKLEECVSALPNLKILILPLLWSDAVPTLTFIATLRTFCSCLQEVYLPLIPEIPALLLANISAYHPLKKLFVTPIQFDQEATFENQLRVSQFITQLFPDAAVDLRRTSNSTATGFWEKV